MTGLAAAEPGGLSGDHPNHALPFRLHSVAPIQSELLDPAAKVPTADGIDTCVDVLGEAAAILTIGAESARATIKLVRRRRSATRAARYRHLPGDWYQYHLTYDDTESQSEIWVGHTEHISMKRDRLTGISKNHYKTSLEYAIEADIPDPNKELTFEYKNRKTDERLVRITITDLLREDLLYGYWDGDDFNGRRVIGPIFYSKQQLSMQRLRRLLTTNPLPIIGTRSCAPRHCEDGPTGINSKPI